VRSTASRRMAARTILPVAVLRDARKSALLRTRSNGDIDMIQTSETELGMRLSPRRMPLN
jgi:hypothetical protein